MRILFALLLAAGVARADTNACGCESVNACRRLADASIDGKIQQLCRVAGCALGDGYACFAINDPHAADLSEKGCKAGDDLSCYAEALLDVPHFPAHSLELFEKLCAGNVAQGCWEAARAYGIGVGTRRDAAKAADYYAKGCELGDEDSCAKADDGYAAAGLAAEADKDYPAARRWYDTACDHGGQRSCDLLGFLYEHGLPDLDYKKAFDLYYGSCEAGVVKGCYDEGRLYLEGLGTRQSDAMASDLFEKTCDQEGYGCAELGHLILLGRAPGVLGRAEELFRKGCDKNIGDACGELAVLEEKDPEVRVTTVIAHYELACHDGHGPSCGRLGLIYLAGDIVEKNDTLAQKLFIRGCSLGDADSCAAGARQIQAVP